MSRQCVDCGAEIAVNPGAGGHRRYCEACSPARRRPERKAPVLTITPPPTPEPRYSVLDPLLDRTRTELDKAGRSHTWEAASALKLAELIDAGGYTAQGAAALIKAHREALEVALEGVAPDADVIDVIFDDGLAG